MSYNIVHKNFNRIFSWLRDLKFDVVTYADLLILARKTLKEESLPSADKNVVPVYVFHSNGKYVVFQRVGMGKIDYKDENSKIWIHLHLTAREAVDVG